MKIKRFQEGGAAPAPAEGAAPQGGANPEEQIMQMAQQIVQQLGPEAAALLAQAIMQMIQGAQQGAAPEAGAAPTYAKKGGKLVKVTRK